MGYMSGTLFILLGLFVGAGLGLLLRRYWLERQTGRVRDQAQDLLTEARKEAETIKKEAILQAKDNLFQMKAEFDKGEQRGEEGISES